jgi:DNA-binding NtrC family response regulator
MIASSGAEALSLFANSPFTIVVTDFAIHNMNSLNLATYIKKISPATPIILLVGGESEDDINQLENGKGLFYSIIFKPFKMNELQSAIEGALIYGYR